MFRGSDTCTAGQTLAALLDGSPSGLAGQSASEEAAQYAHGGDVWDLYEELCQQTRQVLVDVSLQICDLCFMACLFNACLTGLLLTVTASATHV